MPHNPMDMESLLAIKDISLFALQEARSIRRWRLFWRFFFLAIVLFIIAPSLWQSVFAQHQKHVVVLHLSGVISEDALFNAHDTITAINDATSDPNTAALLLSLNSPGGSPVQSARIYKAIEMAMSAHPKIHIYAVINDICASGCYYVASAAEKIIAHRASIVGSIGVIMQGFGMVELLKKIGLEDRTIAVGKNKNFLSPFEKINPAHLEMAQSMLEKAHKVFISDVKLGRKDKLKNDPTIFSGAAWMGEDAFCLGLVDELDTLESILYQEFRGMPVIQQSLDTFPKSLIRKLSYEFTGSIVSQYFFAKMR